MARKKKPGRPQKKIQFNVRMDSSVARELKKISRGTTMTATIVRLINQEFDDQIS